MPEGPFNVDRGGAALACEASGAGAPTLLLHGLSATRRYVLHGSRVLERRGLRVVSFDARGHGESGPAPDGYGYDRLAADALAVLDAAGSGSATLIGHSMGAATAIAVALAAPERVAALVLVSPAYLGAPTTDASVLADWDALAAGLERDGVEGFLAAYEPQLRDSEWRERVLKFTRQRLERHRHPAAVAAALREVPRSAAFDGLDHLAEIAAPVLVVGSRDEADPGHPLAVAEDYARRLGAPLVVEPAGESPLPWRGAQLSRTIAEFLEC